MLHSYGAGDSTAQGSVAMKPLFLNEDELTAIMTAAAALEIRNRGPFLEAITTALRAGASSRSGPVSSTG